MIVIFLQSLIHNKMEVHAHKTMLIRCLYGIFQLKHDKMEVFETPILLLLHAKNSFLYLQYFFLTSYKIV